MAHHPVSAVSRRVVLGVTLAGGVGALTGCEGPDVGPTGPTSSGTPSPVTQDSPDRELVLRALASVDLMLAALVTGPVRRAREAAPLRRLHRAHRTVLLGSLGGAEPSEGPSAGTPMTRREIPAREEALQAELVAGSLQAQDGLVARLLAVMSAAIAQQLAVLPRPGPPPSQPGATTPEPAGAPT
jgi:hypothetical protein